MTCQGSEAGRASMCGQSAALRSQTEPHRVGRKLRTSSPSTRQTLLPFPSIPTGVSVLTVRVKPLKSPRARLRWVTCGTDPLRAEK